AIRGDEPIRVSAAIVLCIRNESPDRVARNLAPMMEGLVASGYATRFHVYVLSDSGEAAAAEEEARFTALTDAWRGRVSLTYRRRPRNDGFKAGNIKDFCERSGRNHELMLTLDADSFMTAN